MNERLAKVLEYEKRLMQDRQQLQNLIAESDGNDSQLIKSKLEYFSQELAYMNRQAEILKGEVQEKPQTEQTVSQTMAQKVQLAFSQPQMSTQSQPKAQGPMAQAPMQQRAQIPAQAQMQQRAQVPAQSQMQQRTQVPAQSSKQPLGQGDLEKAIGKSLMGIFASVLIFISLILFATLLLPYFNDTAKMITTYVVSFAFIAVGLLKLRKDKTNKFYLALTSCGLGALYISLLLSNMYFKVLGDIPLYILIAVWGIGVCALSRLQTMLFQIIGHLGILISVIFGCVLCLSTEDTLKFTVLLIFYFVTSGMFLVTHYNREICKNLIFHIFNTINYFWLVIVGCLISGSGFSVTLVVLLLLLAANMGFLLWSKTEQYGISFAILSCIFSWELWEVLNCMLQPDIQRDIQSLVIFMLVMALFIGIDFKKIEGNVGKYIVQGWLLIMAACVTGYHDFMELCGYVTLFVWPTVLLGFFRKNIFCKYVSLFMIFAYLFDFGADNEIVQFFLVGVTIVGMYGLMCVKRDQYQAVFKYLLHTITLLFLMINFSEMVQEVVDAVAIKQNPGNIVWAMTYTAVAAFNLAMLKSPMGNNLKTGKRENPAYHLIINMLVMIVGTFAIGFADNDFWHFWLIVVTIGVFMVNSKNLLDNRKNMFAGMYVGFKFTVLMIVILCSFKAVNYVISIACFLFAIISIILGFKFEYKSLRIFGLILSMLSTFKLIMIDITYQNTLGNALSFFASGLLCFVISLIYNLIDGRLKKENIG